MIILISPAAPPFKAVLFIIIQVCCLLEKEEKNGTIFM